VIRPAREADSEAIATLLEQLGYEATTEGARFKLTEWEAERGGIVLVAEERGEVAGVVALQVAPYFERPGRRGRIVAMVVDGDHRRAGIGRALMEAAESEALARGCVDMEVTSRRTRAEAHDFYRALGYTDRCEISARYTRQLAG
jgi:GNAT superfamily N-acetyltransferase